MRIRKWYHSNENVETVEDNGVSEFFNHMTGSGGLTNGEEPADGSEFAVEEGNGIEAEEHGEVDDDRVGGESVDGSSGDFQNEVQSEVEEEESSPAESALDPNSDFIKNLQDQNAQLMQMIQQMQGQINTPVSEPEPTPDPYESDAFKKLIEVFEFSDAEANLFAAFMKQRDAEVAAQAVKDAMAQAPQLVNQHVTVAQKQERTRREFYEKHPKLKPMPQYVAQVANHVAQMNPNIGMEELLDMAASESYRLLGIEPGIPKSVGAKKKPAFAKTPKARKTEPKLTGQAKQIADMLAIS